MPYSDKALDHYLSLNPTVFDVLDRFEFRQQERWIDTYCSKYVYILEFWLSSGSSDDPRRLHLLFDDVQQLRFEARVGPLTLPLVIRSLQHDQWEYLRYRVIDREEEILAFYSRGFAAELIEGSTQG